MAMTADRVLETAAFDEGNAAAVVAAAKGHILDPTAASGQLAEAVRFRRDRYRPSSECSLAGIFELRDHTG